MLLQNAITKAEKLSGQKITIDEGNRYTVEYKGYIFQFYRNGRDEPGATACNFYTYKKWLRDDPRTDSYEGTFHDNPTKAFKFIDIVATTEKIIPGIIPRTDKRLLTVKLTHSEKNNRFFIDFWHDEHYIISACIEENQALGISKETGIKILQ